MTGYRRRAGAGHVYRPLLNMARMFMAESSARMSAGKTESFAYVFDMNDLFEEFVAEFVRRELRELWLNKGWHMRPQSATRSLLRDRSAARLFSLRPDLRFENVLGEAELIVDTKYKLLDPATAKSGVSEADAYQMFAYARRYQCDRVVLLYPQNGDEVFRNWGSEETGPLWLEARTLDLRRDFTKKADRDALKASLVRILTDIPFQ